MTEKKKKLFPTKPLDEIEINMKIRRFGEVYELQHVFREPTAADKKARLKVATQTTVRGRGRNQSMQFDYAGANIMLWDRCILRVEGYDLNVSDNQWRDKVDAEHKRIAIEMLLEAIGDPLDEEDSKN